MVWLRLNQNRIKVTAKALMEHGGGHGGTRRALITLVLVVGVNLSPSSTSFSVRGRATDIAVPDRQARDARRVAPGGVSTSRGFIIFPPRFLPRGISSAHTWARGAPQLSYLQRRSSCKYHSRTHGLWLLSGCGTRASFDHTSYVAQCLLTG